LVAGRRLPGRALLLRRSRLRPMMMMISVRIAAVSSFFAPVRFLAFC